MAAAEATLSVAQRCDAAFGTKGRRRPFICVQVPFPVPHSPFVFFFFFFFSPFYNGACITLAVMREALETVSSSGGFAQKEML